MPVFHLYGSAQFTNIDLDHAAYCGTNDLAIYRADGSLYGKCSGRDYGKKIDCGAVDHDVVKHYVCG